MLKRALLRFVLVKDSCAIYLKLYKWSTITFTVLSYEKWKLNEGTFFYNQGDIVNMARLLLTLSLIRLEQTTLRRLRNVKFYKWSTVTITILSYEKCKLNEGTLFHNKRHIVKSARLPVTLSLITLQQTTLRRLRTL